MSVFQTVADAISGVLPDGWKFTGFEPSADLPDVTSVTLKVRSVRRLPAAPIGHLEVDWILTVTSPYPSRERADPQLFDDLLDFIAALDTIPGWFAWTEANKTVGDDLDRLAYDITIRTNTH